MTVDEIFNVIVGHTQELMIELEEHVITPQDSLHDLGANSIDRSEIVMMTCESLSLWIPLVKLAGAQNIGELARIIHDNL